MTDKSVKLQTARPSEALRCSGLRPSRATKSPARRSLHWLVRTSFCCLFVACGHSPASEVGPTAVVERGRIERIVVATGTIEPEKEVEVRPRISGIVELVRVEAGDEVEADQPLVEIERELLEAHVEEARARLAGSRAELTRAKSELRRVLTLRRDGTVPERDEEDAQARHDSAAAAVAGNQAVLDALLIQLDYTTVTAPMRGRILDVDVKKGTAVASVASVVGGTRVLTIADDSELHIDGLVDENEISWVKVGQDASIRTEAYPGQAFAGKVRRIKPLGERQQNVTYFEVEVSVVDEGGARLRTRMSADADIVTEVVEDALIVPETALLYDGERIYVEKVTSSTERHVEEQTIRVGIVDKGLAQVLEGLSVGDEVRLK
jgi:HlyD family secretion protein